MDSNDGGPAFPNIAGNTVYSNGMSLRDWFAGQALAGLMARGMPSADDAAWAAFAAADAMLDARK